MIYNLLCILKYLWLIILTLMALSNKQLLISKTGILGHNAFIGKHGKCTKLGLPIDLQLELFD